MSCRGATLAEEAEERIAAELAAARRQARPADLPADWHPADLQSACRLQHAVTMRLGAVRGWKVSALTAQQQQALGLRAPVAAPLPAPWFLSSPAHFSRTLFCQPPLLECEFAFMLGADLPERERDYTRAEVEAAIASVHPVFEVCDSRLAAGSSALRQLADGFSNGGFVVGPACADWRRIDYRDHAMVLRRQADGAVLAHGSGAAILGGDPVAAVVAMANLSPYPLSGLHAGQIITTGSCTKPFAVTEDGVYAADFGSLGKVELRFGTEEKQA